MKKYFLESAVFLCGSATMMIELTGSRVLAPHIGTSIMVWTSLIGVILGFLSLGYAWGGKIADKRPERALLSKLILFVAIWVALSSALTDLVVMFVSQIAPDLRITAVISTILIFGFPSVLLGMVSPFAARIRNTQVQHTGATVGMLYAISTTGSIFGTFLAGFYLVSYFSNVTIFIIIACLLIVASALVFVESGAGKKALLVAVLILMAGQSQGFAQSFLGSDFVDVNTPYSRVWIYDIPNVNPRNSIRMMQINDETSSAQYLFRDELAAPYCRFYRLAAGLKPSLKKALMIGGGAYTFPMDFIRKNPEARMDVVEIDPKLKELAKKYFRLKDDPRLRIFHEDARTYLNRTDEKYDVIFVDTFRSFSPPFQLTTRECVGRMHAVLNEDGMVMTNIISSISGEKGQILRAYLKTIKLYFPYLYVLKVHNDKRADFPQNLMVMAFKKRPKLSIGDVELNNYLQQIWIEDIPEDRPVLRDDFAPVDRYEIPVMKDMLKFRRNEMMYRIKRRVYAV